MRKSASFSVKLVVGLAFAVTCMMTVPTCLAQDVAHAVTGIVKHVDHGSRKVVVKVKDRSEQTIKYTDKTTVEIGKVSKKGAVDSWLGTKDGAKVTVRYTVKAGNKTAIAFRDATEKTGDALK
ncbi:hypothetical protein SAMN05421771_1440 [Granulicella pectinivorans]|uniref:DUF5666 domain-containing protein n=1 Tax=Granulicella pectinivorans TaxID=474950 RepID=A0A1I6LXP1_9BACT|nr:hypothetical protein [Granulicella pectinivorans]SFS08168.1 hypothetical protein SAMN05421771_1440 [Granulicella pectinivorans]